MDLQTEIIRRVWSFEFFEGRSICWLIQLAANGAVLNYDHRNERSWAIDDGNLINAVPHVQVQHRVRPRDNALVTGQARLI